MGLIKFAPVFGPVRGRVVRLSNGRMTVTAKPCSSSARCIFCVRCPAAVAPPGAPLFPPCAEGSVSSCNPYLFPYCYSSPVLSAPLIDHNLPFFHCPGSSVAHRFQARRSHSSTLTAPVAYLISLPFLHLPFLQVSSQTTTDMLRSSECTLPFSPESFRGTDPPNLRLPRRTAPLSRTSVRSP
jgi:hypothetical protein